MNEEIFNKIYITMNGTKKKRKEKENKNKSNLTRKFLLINTGS